MSLHRNIGGMDVSLIKYMFKKFFIRFLGHVVLIVLARGSYPQEQLSSIVVLLPIQLICGIIFLSVLLFGRKDDFEAQFCDLVK